MNSAWSGMKKTSGRLRSTHLKHTRISSAQYSCGNKKKTPQAAPSWKSQTFGYSAADPPRDASHGGGCGRGRQLWLIRIILGHIMLWLLFRIVAAKRDGSV